jgi:hypothetical protein
VGIWSHKFDCTSSVRAVNDSATSDMICSFHAFSASSALPIEGRSEASELKELSTCVELVEDRL